MAIPTTSASTVRHMARVRHRQVTTTAAEPGVTLDGPPLSSSPALTLTTPTQTQSLTTTTTSVASLSSTPTPGPGTLSSYLGRHVFIYVALCCMVLVGAWMWDRSRVQEEWLSCQGGYHDVSHTPAYRQAHHMHLVGLLALGTGLFGMFLFWIHFWVYDGNDAN